MKDVKLNCTPHIADGLCRASQIKQHLRDNACGVTHVQKGEVREEEIHGAVQTESNLDTRMMALFPIMAMAYVIRRIMNRGSSSQGRSSKPSRMNSSGWLSLIAAILFNLFHL
jgi:hypothetical protein